LVSTNNLEVQAGDDDQKCMLVVDDHRAGRDRCLKADAAKIYYGLCQYTGCYTEAAFACEFPFKYKGRTYDSCVSLEGRNAWCSTYVDLDRNHLDGNDYPCDDTCSAFNCPVGYYTAFPDTSCYRVSPPHGDATAKSFEEARDVCRAEGGRLWEPRNRNFLSTLLEVDEHYVGGAGQHFGWVHDDLSATAIGLRVKY